MPMFNKDYDFDKDALLHKLQSEVESMTVGLTDKQKQLFQEDKYVLVDTIILLENKLKEVRKVVKYQQNELELCQEEIEAERQARCAAEGAHIKAQEEIDGTEKPVKLTKIQEKGIENMAKTIVSGTDEIHEAEAKDEIDEADSFLEDRLSFDEKVLRAIGKYEKKTIKEEGENGVL